MMALVMVMTAGMLAFLIGSTLRSVRDERTPGRSLWREFGLSFFLMMLFFISCIGQLISEWQLFTDEQLAHGEEPEIGDFVAQFAQSTLENWQSEFLQLFTFVALAALYIHKGSGESKDGSEKLEASLRRIEEHLGTLPSSAPDEPGEDWKLPETPLEATDSVARHTSSRDS